MWVEQTGLAEIDTKLRYGATDEVDQLLREVLSAPAAPTAVPVCCPTCRRDLVRQPLAIAGLFGSACPEGHGAWLSPEVTDSLRALVGHRAADGRRHRIVLLGVLVGLSLIGLAIVSWPQRPSTAPRAIREVTPAPGAVDQTTPVDRHAVGTPRTPAEKSTIPVAPTTIDRVDNARLSESYWPDRPWPGARPIPLKESRIDVYEELVYFDQLLSVLEVGITNRLNMEGVLAVRRSPERYTALYAVYRERQENVLERLRALPVPGRLQPVHDPIVRATERQMAFYGEYTRAKAQDPTIDLRRMLAHPDLREQNQLLLQAWTRVGQLYVGLDTPTHEAIYYHLCGFDTI
jgi:hypothetical protein